MTKIIRPTLVIDKEICQRNIGRMAHKARDLGVRFRPHFKTHQSAAIGEWFRDFGVEAITVSSVQMAEYFARCDWHDITIAFPVNILELACINRLAASIRLNLLIENRESALELQQKITAPMGVFLKIDTGTNRTGIDPSKTTAIKRLIDILSENKNLEFRGFLTHNGRTYRAGSTNEIFGFHFDALLKMKKLKQLFQSAFPSIEVSIGDTPSATLCTNFMGVDEIRPGNFVFYDLMQQSLGVCSFEDIAVRLVCPVVAKHPARNEVVIYGGAIHLSRESLTNVDGKEFFGRIVISRDGEKQLLNEQNYVVRLSQEHGIVKVSQKNIGLFQVGDLIEIVPIHSCLTANLAREYLTTNGEKISMINS